MSLMESPRRSRRKLYWGCAGAALSFVIVLALAWMLVQRFMMGPMPLVPPETFLTPDAAAVLLVRIEADDPLMAEIPAELTATAEAQRLLAPGSEGPPRPLQAAGIREKLTPLQAVATWSFNFQEDRPYAGLAISLGRGGRAFGSSIGNYYHTRAAGTALEHAGAFIWPGRTTYSSFSQNTFMVTTALPLAKDWLERFQAVWPRVEAAEEAGTTVTVDAEDGASTRLRECLGRLDGGAPLRFAVVNEKGQMTLLLARLAAATPPESRDAVENAFVNASAVAAQVTSRDATSGSLTLHVAGPAESAPAIEQALEGAGMASVRVSTGEDGWLRCTAIIPELPGKAAALVTALAQTPASAGSSGPAPQ